MRGRLAVAAGLALSCIVCASSVPVASADPDAYVSPFVGTDTNLPDLGTGGSAGATFPGAVAPHGMVQWSPDTIPSTVNFAGGYTYRDTRLRGFSLTHLSGPGCAALEDFPILPTTTPVLTSPAVAGSSDLAAPYIASFSHSSESARPGYYQVELDPGTTRAVAAELTAVGTRTSLGRFIFPSTRASSVLINAGGSTMGDYDASVTIAPGRRLVTGTAQSGEFCFEPLRYRLYFAAQFDRPFSAYGTWKGQLVQPGSLASLDATTDPSLALTYKPIPGGPTSIPGDPSGTAQAGAYVSFDTTGDRAVEVRVALSSVSVADAVANLHSEGSSWSFDAARRNTSAIWDRALGKVQASGGSSRDLRTFYTALYHTMLEPQIYSDANGRYMGMDGRTHTAVGYTQYANFSGWDIYRTEIPLTAMLDPPVASDEIRSLLADEQQSGWLPKWGFLNQQTDIQVGDPADPIIAGAYAFGARDFDVRQALAAMVHGATQTGSSPNNGYVERQALPFYERLHYIPEELNNGSGSSTTPYVTGGGATIANRNAVWGSAATTLEYTTADFAIARFAGAIGSKALCRSLLTRSGYWQRLLNPATHYLQPRYATGLFDSTFDPTQATGWVEGSTAQYTWMVSYDVSGLINKMGGRAAARARLDRFFTKLNDGPTSPYAFLGNEPTLETPWLYDWTGPPEQTQEAVRRAVLALYGPGVDDYPGNDDLGTMAAWVVFADLGLYPEIPGSDELVLASPLFARTVVHLAHGDLTLNAPAASDSTPYVRALKLNGHRYQHDWLTFSALSHGARLNYTLANTPGSAGLAGPPPSYSPQTDAACTGFPAAPAATYQRSR